LVSVLFALIVFAAGGVVVAVRVAMQMGRYIESLEVELLVRTGRPTTKNFAVFRPR